MPSLTRPDALVEGYRASGADLRARAGAGEDLAELAARLRAAASVVEAQVAVHRGLLAVDWHGSAAYAFVGLLGVRALRLQRLAADLADLADSAARRAAAGDGVRASAGWAW